MLVAVKMRLAETKKQKLIHEENTTDYKLSTHTIQILLVTTWKNTVFLYKTLIWDEVKGDITWTELICKPFVVSVSSAIKQYNQLNTTFLILILWKQTGVSINNNFTLIQKKDLRNWQVK